MRALRRYVTLTMASGLKPTAEADQYKVKIYVGSGPDLKKVDARAAQEIEKFMATSSYTSYAIANRKYKFFPSAYEYTVQFSRA